MKTCIRSFLVLLVLFCPFSPTASHAAPSASPLTAEQQADGSLAVYSAYALSLAQGDILRGKPERAFTKALDSVRSRFDEAWIRCLKKEFSKVVSSNDPHGAMMKAANYFGELEILAKNATKNLREINQVSSMLDRATATQIREAGFQAMFPGQFDDLSTQVTTLMFGFGGIRETWIKIFASCNAELLR